MNRSTVGLAGRKTSCPGSRSTSPLPTDPVHATLHVPADGLPVPAAILFPDAAGPRETFRAVADRLAATGYAVLLPDVYHRLGEWRPFDAETVFSDPPERERLMTMARSVTAEMTTRDAGAFLAFLAGRPEVAGPRVGVFGYCMGGRAALLVAGRFPDRVGAAASFHGGRLADAADPDSPHRLADRVQAAVYVAAAENDATFPPEQYARLEAAYTAAGVQHTMEVYPAAHGFAVPDNGTYDAAADERHRAALHGAVRHPSAGRPGDAAEGRGPGLHRSRARYTVAVGMGGRGAVLPARRPVLRRPGGRRARPRRRRRRRRDAAVAPRDADTAVQTDADAQAWRAAGVGWVGGTLAGVRSKLGYLARLGVTALWVSPMLQAGGAGTRGRREQYHGYATQDFLTVDPRFGTRHALRALVDDAHAAGLRVILDVVLNHAGDVFAYEPTVFDARGTAVSTRWRAGGPGGPRAVHHRAAAAALAVRRGAPGRAAPAGRVHPQRADRRLEPVPRVRRGRLRGAEGHRPRQRRARRLPAVAGAVALTRAYCWWLAFADLDGFRVDTVKHMDRAPPGTSPRSCTSSRSRSARTASCWSARSPGPRGRDRDHGARRGWTRRWGSPRCRTRLVGAATGAEDPAGYFALFRNSELIGKDSHTWLRDTVVTGIDDHDLVRQGSGEGPAGRDGRRPDAGASGRSRSTC